MQQLARYHLGVSNSFKLPDQYHSFCQYVLDSEKKLESSPYFTDEEQFVVEAIDSGFEGDTEDSTVGFIESTVENLLKQFKGLEFVVESTTDDNEVVYYREFK